jgi:glycosyltransferase involved in cell wall biosynthesis
LPDLYRTADLFLLPSDSEIVGMVLLESLYFKLPVATTSTAGALDIISPEHGFIFNGLDLQHWTDALLRFLANNTHRAFRQAMRAFAFDRDWDSLAGRYIDFYQQVCSASGLTPNSKKAEGVLNAPE